ncbi:MAG: Cdc6/Cdc18 family protein, partial [Candidatus Heimdallarchaeota archaeon]
MTFHSRKPLTLECDQAYQKKNWYSNHTIVFNYSLQLEDILAERSKEGFHDEVLGEGVISLCAALAAQEHGDARRALDLLRVAAEIAEREDETKVLQSHVRNASKQIEKNTIQEALVSLPVQTKLVLWGVYVLEKSTLKVITTGEMYKVYLE